MSGRGLTGYVTPVKHLLEITLDREIIFALRVGFKIYNELFLKNGRENYSHFERCVEQLSLNF